MENQSHGFIFENLIICEKTGMTGEEYRKKNNISYTSKFDLVTLDSCISIKTFSGGTVCFGDIKRFIESIKTKPLTVIIRMLFSKRR